MCVHTQVMRRARKLGAHINVRAVRNNKEKYQPITYGKPENGQKIGRDQPLYQYLKKEMQEVAITTGQ